MIQCHLFQSQFYHFHHSHYPVQNLYLIFEMMSHLKIHSIIFLFLFMMFFQAKFIISCLLLIKVILWIFFIKSINFVKRHFLEFFFQSFNEYLQTFDLNYIFHLAIIQFDTIFLAFKSYF